MDFSEFRLQGFKPFKQEATLPTSDITLIYGPNSGGKSSLIHSLLLLSQTARAISLRQIESDDLQFNGPLAQQGTFKTCVHRGDTSTAISFSTISRPAKDYNSRYLDYAYGLFQRPAISLDYSYAKKGDSTTKLTKRAFRLAPYYDKEYVFVESNSRHGTSDESLVSYQDQLSLPSTASASAFRIGHKDIENLRSRHHEVLSYLTDCCSEKMFSCKSLNASAIWALAKSGWTAKDIRIRKVFRQHLGIRGEMSSFLAMFDALAPRRTAPYRLRYSPAFNPLYNLISLLDESNPRRLDDACTLLESLEVDFIYDVLLSLPLQCEGLGILPARVHNRVGEKESSSWIKELRNQYPGIINSFIRLVSDLSVKDVDSFGFLRPDSTFNGLLYQAISTLCLQLSLIPSDELSPLETLSNTTHIGPLRPEPLRVYNASEHNKSSAAGLSAPFLISQGGERLEAEINKWFVRLEIPYELRCRKSDDDLQGPLYTIYLIDQRTKAQVTLADVGFGISQLLPIVLQCIAPSLRSGRQILDKNISIVQQPEIHLHPRLQAELADLFIESISTNTSRNAQIGDDQTPSRRSKASSGVKWIIETHSEILLQRMLRRIREGRLSSSSLKVIYVEPSEEGSSCIEMKVSAEGELITPWPNGFFDSQLDEVFA